MSKTKKKIFIMWLCFIFVCIIAFLLSPDLFVTLIKYLSGKPSIYLYTFLFVIGILRGFTLIPVTYLIIFGLIFVPAVPLYFIIVSGIFISSICVYYFFEYLNLDKMLNKKYSKQIQQLKNLLDKYEMPVVIFWSFNPFLPSDIICYVAGTLRLNIYKFMLSMLIGEGTACAIYIFGGKLLLNYFFHIN